MGLLLSLVLSFVSAVLQVVATLDVSVLTPFAIYQPKAPKSMLR